MAISVHVQIERIEKHFNDHTHIPTTKEDPSSSDGSERQGWNGALRLIHLLLGSNRLRLLKYIIDVFIDIRNVIS